MDPFFNGPETKRSITVRGVTCMALIFCLLRHGPVQSPIDDTTLVTIVRDYVGMVDALNVFGQREVVAVAMIQHNHQMHMINLNNLHQK